MGKSTISMGHFQVRKLWMSLAEAIALIHGSDGNCSFRQATWALMDYGRFGRQSMRRDLDDWRGLVDEATFRLAHVPLGTGLWYSVRLISSFPSFFSVQRPDETWWNRGQYGSMLKPTTMGLVELPLRWRLSCCRKRAVKALLKSHHCLSQQKQQMAWGATWANTIYIYIYTYTHVFITYLILWNYFDHTIWRSKGSTPGSYRGDVEQMGTSELLESSQDSSKSIWRQAEWLITHHMTIIWLKWLELFHEQTSN